MGGKFLGAVTISRVEPIVLAEPMESGPGILLARFHWQQLTSGEENDILINFTAENERGGSLEGVLLFCSYTF